MNSFANENNFSGGNLPSPAATRPLADPNVPAQKDQKAVHLKISWDVAPAQKITILDLTGSPEGIGSDSFAPAAPVAPVVQSQTPKYKYL